MSVMTAGEQGRRARATRERPIVAAVPGRQTVTAGDQRPGPATARRRRGPAGQGAPILTVVPPQRSAGAAQPGIGRPRAMRLARTRTVHPGLARHETAWARPARSRVRLTRRGRIVVAALIAAGVVLVAALAWLAGTTQADAAGSGPPPSAVYHSLRSVVVRPGESLWTIAMQADPTGDPRSVIQEIIDLNALDGTSVQPGQHLWLPRG